MNDEVLTPNRILDAAEEVLRRFGPTKTTVVDVARALNVSHGSVYRHFPSKAALRDAVAERWLEQVTIPLAQVVNEQTLAPERLHHWLTLLIATKQKRAFDDPELFATYLELAGEARAVVKAHVETMIEQIKSIIVAGVAQGKFRTTDPTATAQAIFDATVRFHNPAHASEWNDPHIEADFAGVWNLILHGLAVPAS
jgi:AcrR family transcriptional regulator